MSMFKVKKWFGISLKESDRPSPPAALVTGKDADETAEIVAALWRVHTALDSVYGKGYASKNPDTVVQFMQSLATQKLAKEAADLREIIGSGSGAITVGIEKS